MAHEHLLGDQERARVADAIRSAEEKTSGEIYCVLARASDSYFYPAALFVTLAIVIVTLAMAIALHFWWFEVAPWAVVAVQIAGVAAALGLLAIVPGLRIHFVPHSLGYRRAHENALRQFLARNIHMTQARTGVLIFVSVAEHYAEVVADSGINARVQQERWNEAVALITRRAAEGRLADGFVEAVELVGAELATHFPPGTTNPDELDNHLAEI